MRWFELIFLLIGGILFFCLGWEIWKKEKISLIHDYHHKKVKDTDKKAYTAIMGKSLLVIGIGIILTGIIDFITHALYGWWIFGIAFCAGLIIITPLYKFSKFFIKKYRTRLSRCIISLA